MIKNYEIENEKIWDGRIDSKTDYDAFRWHQWVKIINLNDKSLKPFNGKKGFCFLGFKSDVGIEKNKGRIGARKGPEAIRKEMRNLPCNFSKEVKLFDGGNIIAKENLEDAQHQLEKAVKKILNLNLFPILLGGGHEIAFGHFLGISKFLENKDDKKLGIINFDSHFDNRPYKKGKGSSGTMFRQIYDYQLENNNEYKYLVLGIQKNANTVNLFKFADKSKTEYVLGKEISSGDMFSIFEKIDKFTKDLDHIYLTVCSDVFSSSIAPGVSAPQPLGQNPEDILILFKHVLSKEKTISFDIAEVSPRFDMDSSTAGLASIIIFTLITKLCENIE